MEMVKRDLLPIQVLAPEDQDQSHRQLELKNAHILTPVDQDPQKFVKR